MSSQSTCIPAAGLNGSESSYSRLTLGLRLVLASMHLVQRKHACTIVAYKKNCSSVVSIS